MQPSPTDTVQLAPSTTSALTAQRAGRSASPTRPRSYKHEIIGFLLAICGVLIGLTIRLREVVSTDRAMHENFINIRTAWATHVMKAITWVFNPLTAVILSGLVGLVVWWFSRRWRNGVYIVAAMALSAAITQGAKYVYNRPRPPRIFHLTSESDYSFPSGHTTAVAALSISLVLFFIAHRLSRTARITVIVIAILAIIIVAASRLYLGVHWFTDVCAGGMIGSGSALATSRIRQGTNKNNSADGGATVAPVLRDC